MTSHSIQYILVSNLKLIDRNPRKLTDPQLKKLIKSLQDDPSFLDCRPILCNRVDNTITVYAGNQRVLAAKKLGWKQVPCIIDDNLDPAIIAERIIKDNTHYGEWDYDILSSDYEMDFLINAGFPENFLDIGLGEDEPPKKEKKKKICKNCGEPV